MDPEVFSGEKRLPESEDSLSNDVYRREFNRSILDQAKDYPLPEPVINLVQNLETTVFLTLKSFSLWQGKQKSKKTTLLALAIAAYIRRTPVNEGIRFEYASPGIVMFFDTEQGESYAARTMKLILKLAGSNTSPFLIYSDLRSYSPNERQKIIEAGIKCTPNVKIVVIDGLVDLLTDFMDAAEGHSCITHLIRLCSIYDIHVAGVLHQNKNDKNARAHVGTISSQKCEMEIATEVDPDDRSRSIITCVNSRGLPFEPFAIRWNKGTLPIICQDWASGAGQESKTVKKVNNAKAIVGTVFKPLAALTHTEALKAIKLATVKSESTAKRFLNDLVDWDMVRKGNDGLYRANMDKGATGGIL